MKYSLQKIYNNKWRYATLILTGCALAMPSVSIAHNRGSAGSLNGITINKNGALKMKPAFNVSGKVTDDDNQPLPGVAVSIKGTTQGVTTDAGGNFKIAVPGNSAVLVFKLIGFAQQEITVTSAAELKVQMKKDTKNLEEVVVVGYGSQKRAKVTGAVSSVSGKTLASLPVGGIEALQGRIAGLTVTNNGGPGTGAIISLRGISSVNFGSDPLYIVDGYPGSLTGVDIKDIQSIDVLKDASAAAIYGSRGTNGVIIITTKKGSNNSRTEVTIDSYYGIQNVIKKYDLLNTQQYLQYERALNGSATPVIAIPPRLLPENFNKPIYAGSSQTFAQTNTNWQDAYFRSNAPIQQHNVALSGGNAVTRFYTSANYFDQQGIAQGLSAYHKAIRVNADHTISKILSFGETFNAIINHQRYGVDAGNRSAITNVVRMQPYLPIYNPNNAGGFMGPQNSFDGSDPTNPIEAAKLIDNTNHGYTIHGNAYATLKFTSWLNFKSIYGIDYGSNMNNTYTPIYNDGGTSQSPTAVINYTRGTSTTQLYSQQLTFDKTFGNKHHVNAVLVYEAQSSRGDNQVSSGNQNTNTVRTLNGATNLFTNYTYGTNLLVSEVARLGYDFEGKYLISGSIRRDGLSVFAPGHKHESFPAASLGWKVDQEDFMKSLKSVSSLKLRAGYGVTGINGTVLGNYPYLQPISSNIATYPFNGSLADLGNASFYSGLSNLNLSWETTKQTNIGLDLGLFQDVFTLSAEVYTRKTDNLLLTVPTSPSLGFNGTGTLANVGSMRNRGFEVSLGYHKTHGEFKYDITGNFSLNRNKVLTLSTANASITAGGDADYGGGDPITKTAVGQPVQSFFGYIADGIFQNAGEVANSAKQTNAAPGDIKFRDINHDGVITDADRTFIGSYLPKFTYSLNYSASYKNFDAIVFFQGVYGNKIFNGERIILEGMPRLFNAGTNVLKAWTPTNTNTNIPRAISGDPNGNKRPSTRWIESGSYLRVKNMQIGYNFPTSWLKSKTDNALNRLRIYVASTNLLTFTKYKGLDPEIGSRNGTLTNGIDYGQYPQPRTVQLGLQATF
ncbi:TonB-linked SusC/RagA family outer membrane protein [Mucilaginibacter sp. SG538B]|jgi:TonB-linked SusC/RagA family outer membrane protein|uniref:SusC/RagA family TonB-linked outer membrane protein n=1 Tax=Mucilaginibacter TaxID=423349 RepID=UPI001813D936|nr:TonB-dependent receptor [Mucilaginibacter sp. SG538B]NVM65280.1 TonB-linked SusC/RagA family outer membrane protein [Mucilaginibacter sp. SG538B]